MQHRGLETAALDPLGQIGLESVEQARPLLGHDHHFLPRRGVSVKGNGSMVPAQMPGDLPKPGSLREHLVDQSMMGPTALRDRTLRLLDDFRGCGRSGELLDQAALVLDDQAFDRRGEVLPEVEAVGDLHRVGAPARAPSA
jgi:hypothetical protein